MTKKQKKTLIRILIATALFVPLLVLDKIGIVEDWPWYVAMPIFLVPYLIAGYNVLWKAVRNIMSGQIFDENFLMCIATIGVFAMAIAFGEAEYPEACMVMLLYQTGELLQGIAVGKSRKSVSKLMDIRPDYANVERDGSVQTVSPDDVRIGEIILVKPGEKIPLDGVVQDGNTNVDTASLTGESLPKEIGVGDDVISGCINMSGVIRVRVTKEYGESTVSKILELVENASSTKAKSENFITRFARYYTPVVVILAVLLGVVPPLLFGAGEWGRWIKLALTCLVVSCPCALVISVPLTFFGGIGGAARKGILVKGANWLEVLAKTDTVVFDKTGTLTKGKFIVTVVHPNRMAEQDLLYLAAAAECYSNHPISISLRNAYKKEIDCTKVTSVEEIVGQGVKAVIEGKTVLVGGSKMMNANRIHWQTCEHTGAVVHVAVDGVYAGHVEIMDEVKEDAVMTIEKLKPRKTIILTGDNEAVGKTIANQLAVDEVYCGLLPDGKVAKVEEFLAAKKKGSVLAFVGDGMNDAPVLSRADLGIAMGALGSDAAIEAADVVLMDDKPSKIPLAIKIARKTKRIVLENVIFSLAVKVAVLALEIILTLDGNSPLEAYSMPLAAFADVGVLVLAVLNATRTLYVPKE